MDVVEWVNDPRAIVSQRQTSARFFSPAILGLAGTLLIHVSAIQSLYLSHHTRKAHPPKLTEPASSGFNSTAESAENLVLIDLPPSVKNREPVTTDVAADFPATRTLNKAALTLPVDSEPPVLTSLETLAVDEQKESGSVPSSGEGEDCARLLGIYSGQIQARIERIWRRPRTPISAETSAAAAATSGESFQCQVQIVQDTRGNVQEVLLPRCNGSHAWQRSLVLAIQQASPLPAPPSAKVFSQSMTLNFVGFDYVAGSPDDDYEVLPSNRTQVTSALPHSPGSIKR